ncbi:hypothetical protein [Mesobacillus zeae]|uniref:Uncharacterized protein n=1 Tax=Mesobacillus zeae TaxID=1917180 RepID=A0A398B1D8_9BACI|nr:hypothetical protein [Mesobacillus zeae]RID81626.1 hypothetical protein D1970_21270 [Mesobacillus zeae]
MIKIVGFTLAISVWTFIAYLFTGIDIPIPSSYISLVILTNAIFALFSIFVQRFVIILYEVNVFEEPKSIGDFFFKYFAILSSGVNYYTQNVFNRLPLVVNKLASIIFFVFLVVIGTGIMSIFN